MPNPEKVAYIPPDHVQLLLNCLDNVKNGCISCAKKVLATTKDQVSVTRMAQFVVLVLLQLVLGLAPNGLHVLLGAPAFAKVRDWIAALDGTFPGGSTGYKYFASILEHAGDKITQIACTMQDAFQQDVGRAARDNFTSALDARRVNLVPGPDCFIGIMPPGEILGTLPVGDRGVLLPFLNAWIYMHGRKITSTSEFIGLLKTPVIEGDRLYFPLAGTLGFYRGPPGKNEFYLRFHQIDVILSMRNEDVSIKLVKAGIMDMTVVTIDTMNVPVDKKDKTGSVGTGSRGTFFGHKEAISTDAKCMPIAGELHEGRRGDIPTFDGVFEPAKGVARKTGQDTWTGCADAGFSAPDIVDKIEAAGAVAFVDVNPKQSARLKALVTSAEALDKISTKAFNALSIEERQSWRGNVRAISAANNGPVPLNEKKKILKRILRNLAARAIRKGLTIEERQEERQRRADVTRARRDIRLHGTAAEKKLGLTTIPLGTTEWKLVYATRGQNEGINSIVKKRGDIIGDGQHASWFHGAMVLGPRCNAVIAGIKIVALVGSKITGKTRHCMKWLHNWRRSRIIFVFVVHVIIRRETPLANP
ncbi:MAG: hypothetical protein Q6365_000015 [Candidatus Sigynarchaeota archaeon]